MSMGRSPTLLPEQAAIRARCVHPSGTFVEFARDEVEQSIPERFEKIADKFPDRIAVKSSEKEFTYANLNRSANRIAHLILARLGRRAGCVALIFENGAPLMAAMLGALKAGKFLTLLSPFFPQARIAAVLEDCQAKLIIADRQNASIAREIAGSRYRMIEFDSIDSSPAVDNPRLPILPKALAFVFYTSGSTGQPKGVMQNHRNILHNVMLRTNTYRIHEEDKISLLAAATSNAVINALLAVLNGAALFPFEVRKGAARLADWMAGERISISFISAPLFRNFAESLKATERFPRLRIIRLVSEAVHRSDLDLYRQHFSADCILVNALSSSETGPLRKYLMGPETEFPGNDVPVGYALEDKEILLLDDAGKEVGFDKIGEIAVRSSYLSPGYWRRPDLTKLKFKRDSNGRTVRLYLSGDLGLRLTDDCIVYKGHKDFRIKIRGYSVEIGEVEACLSCVPGVREAVVAARQNEAGEFYLVGYFSSDSHPALRISQLRNFLKEKLPDYMMPAAFVSLKAIPRTPGGKINRNALPDSMNSRPDLDIEYVQPRTPVEKQLISIWAKVLSLDRVGIHDNFFDLGGHSLSVIKVASQAIDKFDLKIPIGLLIATPTVAGMAAAVVDGLTKKLGTTEVERILTQLETLTDEEARKFLRDEHEEQL
jgi:acyl-coenzyme A synthetase/AMP-(fatty) acid ligase/acyl carrier protein